MGKRGAAKEVDADEPAAVQVRSRAPKKAKPAADGSTDVLAGLDVAEEVREKLRLKMLRVAPVDVDDETLRDNVSEPMDPFTMEGSVSIETEGSEASGFPYAETLPATQGSFATMLADSQLREPSGPQAS
jgi:hypothetical protein